MTIQPAPASNALIDEINKLYLVDSVDEVAVYRIKQQAQKLKVVDAVGAHVVLGMLGCLTWNEKEMRENHEAALRRSPSDPLANVNYGTSLRNMNFYSEAFDRWRRVYKLMPNDPDVVDTYVDLALLAGRFSESLPKISQWENMHPGKKHSLAGIAVKASAFLSKMGIGDDETERFQRAVSSVLCSEHARVAETTYAAVEESGSEAVVCEFSFNLPPDDIVDLNMKVADNIASELGGDWPRSIVYMFSPLEEEAQPCPSLATSS